MGDVRMQPAYINFIAFYTYLCVYVDSLHVFPFRQPTVGHMAVPSGDKWQCHNTCGPTCMVDIKVIPHYLFMTFILDPFR